MCHLACNSFGFLRYQASRDSIVSINLLCLRILHNTNIGLVEYSANWNSRWIVHTSTVCFLPFYTIPIQQGFWNVKPACPCLHELHNKLGLVEYFADLNSSVGTGLYFIFLYTYICI